MLPHMQMVFLVLMLRLEELEDLEVTGRESTTNQKNSSTSCPWLELSESVQSSLLENAVSHWVSSDGGLW